MRDLLFVFGTIAFFAIMLAYVVACSTLGKIDEDQTLADISE